MGIMIRRDEYPEPYMVGKKLGSGVGVSGGSELTACALQKWFPEVDVVHPYDDKQHHVVLEDERSLLIERQTCTLTSTIMMPWAAVATRLALVVIPENNNSLILRSKWTAHQAALQTVETVVRTQTHRLDADKFPMFSVG